MSVPARGLFETHLTVADLGRSTAFYRDVVGLQLAWEVDERGAAFFWIGSPGQSMLGLWSAGTTRRVSTAQFLASRRCGIAAMAGASR
jgi:lactoylglutathione lyase